MTGDWRACDTFDANFWQAYDAASATVTWYLRQKKNKLYVRLNNLEPSASAAEAWFHKLLIERRGKFSEFGWWIDERNTLDWFTAFQSSHAAAHMIANRAEVNISRGLPVPKPLLEVLLIASHPGTTGLEIKKDSAKNSAHRDALIILIARLLKEKFGYDATSGRVQHRKTQYPISGAAIVGCALSSYDVPISIVGASRAINENNNDVKSLVAGISKFSMYSGPHGSYATKAKFAQSEMREDFAVAEVDFVKRYFQVPSK